VALFKNFSLMKIAESFAIKGQGACTEIRRETTVEVTEGWNINQASVPSRSSPQNSRTNFVDLSNNG
jgi:hypothetical protein